MRDDVSLGVDVKWRDDASLGVDVKWRDDISLAGDDRWIGDVSLVGDVKWYVSNLFFYAQSTSTVISGRCQVVLRCLTG